MINTQTEKYVLVTPPAAIVDNAAFTTNEIDTIGWDYITIIVAFGAMDIAMAALKVQESDTSGSGFADITGATFASALPSATADNTMFAFYIDLRNRMRYLDVVATGGDGSAGTYMSAIAILSRGTTSPVTVAGRGLAAQVII